MSGNDPDRYGRGSDDPLVEASRSGEGRQPTLTENLARVARLGPEEMGQLGAQIRSVQTRQVPSGRFSVDPDLYGRGSDDPLVSLE